MAECCVFARRTFTVPCDTVHDLIIKQMEKWNSSSLCPTGTEKCGYTVADVLERYRCARIARCVYS